MRIAGLHLRAYGHFTGYSLDFGANPGLHLIYGDNEAGKSTTLRALSSVLFGYPHEVVDGFKHDAKDIVIGIDVLAADGRRLSFARRRRGKNALATAAGSGLDEATVAGFLGGVSRDVFEKVFALDHHRLHAHAKALLADGGSLGFSLAEAGSGIAGLKAVLDKLKEKRAALFLAGGSKPKLNQAIAQVTEFRKEARRRTVSPADYRAREKRIEDADAALMDKRATAQGNRIRNRQVAADREESAVARRTSGADAAHYGAGRGAAIDCRIYPAAGQSAKRLREYRRRYQRHRRRYREIASAPCGHNGGRSRPGTGPGYREVGEDALRHRKTRCR